MYFQQIVSVRTPLSIPRPFIYQYSVTSYPAGRVVLGEQEEEDYWHGKPFQVCNLLVMRGEQRKHKCLSHNERWRILVPIIIHSCANPHHHQISGTISDSHTINPSQHPLLPW